MLKKWQVIVLAVVFLVSFIMPGLVWAEEKENLITITEPQMTLQQVSEKNQLPLDIVLKTLGNGSFTESTTVQQVMDTKSITVENIKTKVRSLQVEKQLEGSKDWYSIKLKFFLWAVFIAGGMIILARARKGIGLRTVRNYIMLAAVLVFGLWLGSDPNPLGTVKDALVLYGKEGTVFKPRLVALTAFILTVVLTGRMLCGWGCHFGVLQDLAYQLPTRKFQLPFWLTQLIRAIFFAAMSILALGWGLDLIEYFDPFKIYSLKPLAFWGSTITAAVILLLSPFIYRPWCRMLCPFGLIASLMEKISLFKIRVNKENCVDCGSCKKVCPTGAIDNINGGLSKAECYNCGSCLSACPVNAIKYGRTT